MPDSTERLALNRKVLSQAVGFLEREHKSTTLPTASSPVSQSFTV
jgi:hypothetical protein